MISAFCYTKTLLRKILILPRVPAVFPFLRTAPLNRKSYTAAYMALAEQSLGIAEC